MNHKPKVIKTVKHRDGTAHDAYVQRRKPRNTVKYGGKSWASWARHVVDGLPKGGPERFETYDTKEEAVAHALYAANDPKSKTERLLARRAEG